MSTYLTPEWPRIREFIRTKIAALHEINEYADDWPMMNVAHRTQDSGIVVALLGS